MLCRYDYALCPYDERHNLYFVMLNIVILSVFMLSIVVPIEGLVLYAEVKVRLGIKIATDRQFRFHVSSF